MKKFLISLREIALVGFLIFLFFKIYYLIGNTLTFSNEEVVARTYNYGFLFVPMMLFFVFFGRVYILIFCRRLFLGIRPFERTAEDKKRYRLRFSALLVFCLVAFAFSFTSTNKLYEDGTIRKYDIFARQTEEKTLEDYSEVVLKCETWTSVSPKTGRVSRHSTIYYEIFCDGESYQRFVVSTFKSEEEVQKMKEVFSEKLTYSPEKEISATEFSDLEEYYLYQRLFFEEDTDESYYEIIYGEITEHTYYDFGV